MEVQQDSQDPTVERRDFAYPVDQVEAASPKRKIFSFFNSKQKNNSEATASESEQKPKAPKFRNPLKKLKVSNPSTPSEQSDVDAVESLPRLSTNSRWSFVSGPDILPYNDNWDSDSDVPLVLRSEDAVDEPPTQESRLQKLFRKRKHEDPLSEGENTSFFKSLSKALRPPFLKPSGLVALTPVKRRFPLSSDFGSYKYSSAGLPPHIIHHQLILEADNEFERRQAILPLSPPILAVPAKERRPFDDAPRVYERKKGESEEEFEKRKRDDWESRITFGIFFPKKKEDQGPPPIRAHQYWPFVDYPREKIVIPGELKRSVAIRGVREGPESKFRVQPAVAGKGKQVINRGETQSSLVSAEEVRAALDEEQMYRVEEEFGTLTPILSRFLRRVKSPTAAEILQPGYLLGWGPDRRPEARGTKRAFYVVPRKGNKVNTAAA